MLRSGQKSSKSCASVFDFAVHERAPSVEYCAIRQLARITLSTSCALVYCSVAPLNSSNIQHAAQSVFISFLEAVAAFTGPFAAECDACAVCAVKELDIASPRLLLQIREAVSRIRGQGRTASNVLCTADQVNPHYNQHVVLQQQFTTCSVASSLFS